MSDSGDPLGQDREAVRKACPKSCRADPSCASHTAPAQVLRKLGLSRPNGPGNPVSRRRVGINTNTQQPAEGLQHTLVVPAREGESLAWLDGAQQVVDPGDRAEKQEEPGRLRRRKSADLVQERILLASLLFSNFADKAVVAYRGAHHNVTKRSSKKPGATCQTETWSGCCVTHTSPLTRGTLGAWISW